MSEKEEKELLQLELSASSWRMLAFFLDQVKADMEDMGWSPDPFSVTTKVSKAIKKQFPHEPED